MSPARRWVKRLRPLVRKDAVERELDDELSFHLDMEAEKYRSAGLGEVESRRRAVLAFGGIERHREGVRGGRWISPVENFVADVRFALRQFRRAPFSRTAMLLILSIGIAVNTGLYARVQGALTLPAPGVPRDESLVRIRGAVDGEGPGGPQGRDLSYAEVLEYAGLEEIFSDVAAWRSATVVVDPPDGQGTLSARANYVTGNYFSLLGISPVAGSGLPLSIVDEPSDALVAVISHDLWTSRFGGSPTAVGSTLRIGGVPVEIVGVAPPRFHGVNDVTDGPSVWLPLGAEKALATSWADAPEEPDPARLHAFARLRDGVDTDQAEAAVSVIAARTETRVFGGLPEVASADVVPLLGGNSWPGFEVDLGRGAAVIGTVTLLILLVTCTNVAGLLVGAALGRRREIATRLSLGASRGRVVLQLLTESMVLSFGAGLLALLMIWGALRIYGRYVPDLPFVLDWKVASFTFGFAILTGLIFGLSPALHASRAGTGEVLKDAAAAVSGSRSRLQRGLVVAQIAVTQPLLVGLGAAVLLIGAELRARPSSDVLERIVELQFRYTGRESNDILQARLPTLVERLRGIPGVVGAIPFSSGWTKLTLMLPAGGGFAETAELRSVAVVAPLLIPGYLELLDVPVVRGRAFVEQDLENDGRPIILGADFARELWGDADPIGRRISEPGESDSGFTVVGVVDDSRMLSGNVGDSGVYSLARGLYPGSRRVLIRTEGAGDAMIPLLRSITMAEVPELAISEATTLAASEAETRRNNLRVTTAVAAGGVLALVLAAIGLYSVIALSVRQRRREIGIRTAVGAQPVQVVGLFFRSGLKLSLIGLALGLPLSLYALRLFSQQEGIPETNALLLFSLIAVGVVGVAAFASWVPAHRAVAGDPTRALRTD